MKTLFITDEKGKKTAAVLPIEEYKKILEELDELEDIKLFDEAKKYHPGSIPADKAFKLINRKRRKKA